jgi:hypothetical protein
VRRIAALASLAVMAAILLVRWRRTNAPAPLAPAASRSAIPSRPAALPAPVEPGPPADSPFLSVPWTLDAAPADRAELRLRCRLDADLELDRIDAQETPTQVFVTALARLGAPADGEREQAATVALSGPLGARELIHAPVDDHEAPSL